jgi:hypothetical protein
MNYMDILMCDVGILILLIQIHFFFKIYEISDIEIHAFFYRQLYYL